MAVSDINLLKRKGANTSLDAWDQKLRTIAIWSIGFVLASGIIIGGVFFYVSARTQSLNNDKIAIISQIQQQSVKEGILVSLKQRIAVADKAMKSAFSWGKLFPLLAEIAPVNEYSNVAVDEKGGVATTLRLASVDEAVTVVQQMIDHYHSQAIKNAQIASFGMGKDGTVQLGFMMTPAL